MAETDEHRFLSEKFLEIIETYSKSEVYGYTEASRKKFDFACNIQRDWSRPLVGQTLWKHQEGVDKDIRSMVLETDTDIWAYIVRDTVKNRALLQEVLQDFRQSVEGNQLFKLKVFPIPPDFDVNDENARKVVEQSLKDAIINDLLFNVVFGRLSSTDVKFFLHTTGIVGLNLAVLYEVASNGFINYSALRDRLGVSVGPLKDKVNNLLGCGFIWCWRGGSYYVSLKGRVFLDLLRKYTSEEKEQRIISQEVRYLFAMLGVDLQPNSIVTRIDYKKDIGVIRTYELTNRSNVPTLYKFIKNLGGEKEEYREETLEAYEPLKNYLGLVRQIKYAEEYWGINLTSPIQFKIHEDENHPYRSLVR